MIHEEKACHNAVKNDPARVLSGNMMCHDTDGFCDKMVLSIGVLAEKNRMFMRSLCVRALWAIVKQGMIWPPDFPATQQIVVVFIFVLIIVAFWQGPFFPDYF